MKKIMFNDRYGLTQAVIEGRKTMTRRIVPWALTEQWMETVSDTPNTDGAYVHESEKDFYEREVPSYEVGEVVAVAQRYEDLADIYQDKDSYLLQLSKVYGCNPEDVMKLPGWTNKMFVKSELMPRRILITGIRCERLQQISDYECLEEGISLDCPLAYSCNDISKVFNTPREAFASLIDKISGRGTWESNPWVVAYEFKLVK